jgi:dolichol-phosphate mannosyltransferase
MRRAFILLPAYDEEPSIEVVVEKIIGSGLPFDLRIVVCDDGSRDGTAAKLENLAKRYPIVVLTHRINRGLGETVRDLFEYVAEHASADDVVFRLDCDDSHEPHFLGSMIQRLDDGYDVVIASRFQPGGGQIGVNARRRFISHGANLYMKILFNIKGVKDYTCGYRCYRGKIVKDAIDRYGNNFIQLKGLGFTCTLEKLVKLKMMRARFAEVPFVLRYDQKQSHSKMVSSITTLGYLVMTLMYFWPFGGWRWQPQPGHTPPDQV